MASLSVLFRNPGQERFRNRLRRLPAEVVPLYTRALERGGALAVAAVRQRAPVKTGALRRSITGHLEGTRYRITVSAPYGAAVERGTRPHIIRARRAKFLRFEVGGRVIFARQVQHPGTRPRWFLRDGFAAARPAVNRIMGGTSGAALRYLGGR